MKLRESERKRSREMYEQERELLKQGYQLIAGVDEVGRGPLAGPVVAAAVIFPGGDYPYGLKDSKQLTHKQREFLVPKIIDRALSIGVGVVDVTEIDKVNINNAALAAMTSALLQLCPHAEYVLVDGIHRLPLPASTSQKTIKSGDKLSLSIAAASIVAKVLRDRYMVALSRFYPSYGFEHHKGYPTVLHKEAIARHGILPVHRRSFKLPAKEA